MSVRAKDAAEDAITPGLLEGISLSFACEHLIHTCEEEI